jgi:hypothetical protein
VAILHLGDRATGVRAKCGAVVADERGQFDGTLRARPCLCAIADGSAPEVALHRVEEVARGAGTGRLGRHTLHATAPGCRAPPSVTAPPNGALAGQLAELRDESGAAQRIEIDSQQRQQLLRRAPPRKALDAAHQQ